VSYAFAEGSILRLNVLDNAGIPSPEDRDLIAGIEGLWRHPTGAVVDAEYAHADWQGSGDAFRLGLTGSYPGVSYRLGLLRASPEYAGPVRDREEYTASLSFPLMERVSVSATLKRERSALDLAAPAVLDAVAGALSWALDEHSSVTASVQRVSFDDYEPDPSATQAYQEEVGRLALSRALGAAKVRVSAEIGAERHENGERPAPTERYRGSVTYVPVPGFTLGTTVTLERAAMEIAAEASWQPDSGTRVALAYRASEKARSFYDGRDSLRLDASHRFPGGMVLSVRASSAPDRSLHRATDFSVQAELSLPLGLPLRKRAAGRIVGTVIDALSGGGVPDVILRVGERIAVTDLRGTFVFPDLPPGRYHVGVDTARVREERLVAEKLPLAVQVEASADSRLEVSLVAPARLMGTARHYRTGEDGTLVPEDPLVDALVELRGDGETRKTLTDREGRFAFQSLPPGTWLLHLDQGALPPYTAFAENDLVLELEPGEAQSFDARVLAVKRELKIVDEGEIIEEAAPEGGGTPKENGTIRAPE
jgi:hypothetical protein